MYKIEEIINTIIQGNVFDVIKNIPSESINTVVTSPPYWGLRDYGINGQLGKEKTYKEYIDNLISIFDEIKRILKHDGSCWVNLGDSYCNSPTGNKTCGGGVGSNKFYQENHIHQTEKKDYGDLQQKSLVGIPDRFKIAMIDNGWICRNEIIWQKPNAMPESVTDRFTLDFEKFYFFTKNKKYYFEQQKEKCINGDPNPPRGSKGNKNVNSGLRKSDQPSEILPQKELRNVRSVWSISTQPIRKAHFATFPTKLIEVPIKSSCPEGGIVLDIFFGSGTTGLVAKNLNRNWIGIELNPEYIKIANERLN